MTSPAKPETPEEIASKLMEAMNIDALVIDGITFTRCEGALELLCSGIVGALTNYGDHRAEEMRERAAAACDAYAQRMDKAWSERESAGKPSIVAASKNDAGTSLAETIRALPLSPATADDDGRGG